MKYFKISISILLALFFIIPFAYGLESQPIQTQEQPPQSNQTQGLPADYYRQLGMPDPTKAWAPFDYIQATSVLSSLLKQNPTYLPHYSDPTGKPYIEHMVDGTNIYQILQYASTHEQRMELVLLYLDGIQRLFGIYQQALSKGAPYYAEWIDIIGLSSYLAAISRPEWEHFMMSKEQGSTMTPEEKSQAVTVLQTALINPVIIGVQASPKLSAQLAWRLVKHLQYSMPMYAAHLPISTQEHIQQALQQAATQSTDKDIKAAFAKLENSFGT